MINNCLFYDIERTLFIRGIMIVSTVGTKSWVRAVVGLVVRCLDCTVAANFVLFACLFPVAELKTPTT